MIGRPHHVAFDCPGPTSSRQVHLDVMADDLAEADAAVLGLGATRLPGKDHVYADPAGHPFCLVARPSWAPRVAPGPPAPLRRARWPGTVAGPVPDGLPRS